MRSILHDLMLLYQNRNPYPMQYADRLAPYF